MKEKHKIDQIYDDDIERKKCTGCRQWKPLEQYSDNKSTKDGKYHYCKTCQRPYQNMRNLLKKGLRRDVKL